MSVEPPATGGTASGPESGSGKVAKPKAGRKKPLAGKLKPLVHVLFGGFAILSANALYLGAITLLEFSTGNLYQSYFYQLMFLAHLALGLLLMPPLIAFVWGHVRNTHWRPNRRAVRAGYALLACVLALFVSGLVLTRLGAFEVRDPRVRGVAYWIHVSSPLVVMWLFVLHRLAGKRIQWRLGLLWGLGALLFAGGTAWLHTQDPRDWGRAGPESGEQYFFPSLSRTTTGDFIPAEALAMDSYCKECHADAHESWAHSMHRFSSFNNPIYLMSVRETRAVALERDGNVQAARFCAGCHDPVPFFSGAFDDPEFDDVNHPTADDGITCTACHAITHVNSVRGNADYTIEEPIHYPFAFSDNPVLAWLNRQLVKAKPQMHKRTFLKPLHETPEFCGACHKVHLPEELNGYKWLRGQNHYDPHRLSGVSGHGVASFYYPAKSEPGCNGCHMKPQVSTDFGARVLDDSGELSIHDHQFPSANTAIPHMLGMPDWVNDAHRSMLEDCMRVDIFGLKRGGTIDGELIPLQAERTTYGGTDAELVPGERYLLEVVVRTLTLGHHFTQGTADSNEVWVEMTARERAGDGEKIVGKSGGLDEVGEVDPWSHFINAFVLDRDGNRIDRRNAQDIFVPLYNHQIPPGAADVIHFVLDVPEDAAGTIEFEVAVHFRKFDTTILRYLHGDDFERNDLPIVTICRDRLHLPVRGATELVANEVSEIPEWQRWNDYGIGLLRKGSEGSSKGELRQAEAAFQKVEELGRPDGPLNLARVYLKEGRVDEAAEALERASAAPPWTVGWLSALVDKQRGELEMAITKLVEVRQMDTAETRSRGFDFTRDERVLNQMGDAYYELAQAARGDSAQRTALVEAARDAFERSLELDPEGVTPHYNLARIYAELGDENQAAEHRALHEKYRTDDNARDRAVIAARLKYPAANHAAEAVVLYDLQRPGRYELPVPTSQTKQEE